MVYKYTRMHSLYIHMAVYNRSGNPFVSIPMLVGTGVGGCFGAAALSWQVEETDTPSIIGGSLGTPQGLL